MLYYTGTLSSFNIVWTGQYLKYWPCQKSIIVKVFHEQEAQELWKKAFWYNKYFQKFSLAKQEAMSEKSAELITFKLLTKCLCCTKKVIIIYSTLFDMGYNILLLSKNALSSQFSGDKYLTYTSVGCNCYFLSFPKFVWPINCNFMIFNNVSYRKIFEHLQELKIHLLSN